MEILGYDDSCSSIRREWENPKPRECRPGFNASAVLSVPFRPRIALNRLLVQTSLLLLGCFLSVSGLAQDNSDWSDWKAAPNFPGIKIRVICRGYVESSPGNALWEYQFMNSYMDKIFLIYEDEAVSSTGFPPVFSTPSEHALNPGEKSDVYSDYLRGTCETRMRIYIRVVSVKDDGGIKMQPKIASSWRSAGAFGRQNADTTPPSPSPQEGQLSAGRNRQSTWLPEQQTPSTPSIHSDLGFKGDVSGTTWTCHADRYAHLGGTAEPLANQEYRFLITFNSDGSASGSGIPASEDPPIVSRWRQDGATVKWSDFGSVESGEGRQYAAPGGAQMLYVVTLEATRLQGGIVFLSTKLPDEHTDLDCEFSPSVANH